MERKKIANCISTERWNIHHSSCHKQEKRELKKPIKLEFKLWKTCLAKLKVDLNIAVVL